MTKKLGVIGGLGSKATAYFFNRLVDLTNATTDQDHIEVIIHNHPQIPDRTAYILGKSKEDPKPYLLKDTHRLLELGCEVIYVPCNTAHYFIRQFESELQSKFVHMIDETALKIEQDGAKEVLLLATSGTVTTALYQNALQEKGIECHVLPPSLQEKLMTLIYDKIKAGQVVTFAEFMEFADYANSLQVEAVILGCTELSLLKEMIQLPDFYVDAMDCAIRACILKSGKRIKTL